MDGLMDGGDRRMEGPLNGVGKRGKGEGHRKGGKGGGGKEGGGGREGDKEGYLPLQADGPKLECW